MDQFLARQFPRELVAWGGQCRSIPQAGHCCSSGSQTGVPSAPVSMTNDLSGRMGTVVDKHLADPRFGATAATHPSWHHRRSTYSFTSPEGTAGAGGRRWTSPFNIDQANKRPQTHKRDMQVIALCSSLLPPPPHDPSTQNYPGL